MLTPRLRPGLVLLEHPNQTNETPLTKPKQRESQAYRELVTHNHCFCLVSGGLGRLVRLVRGGLRGPGVCVVRSTASAQYVGPI